ncbi:MAG: DUF3486 family protein, partial [Sphingomonadales bacterium]|nr:DUF3486 family protein [Sphingomonadales bacterium]
MPVKSSVQTELSKEDRKALNDLIGDDIHSLDELLEWLCEKGYDISRSALGRHAKKINEVGAKLRESRETTEALVKELGPDMTEGKQGRLLVEVLRSLVFDHLSKQLDGDEDAKGSSPMDFMLLAKTLKEMASANKIDTERDLKIREEVERKVKAAAIKAVEGVAKSEGLTANTVAAIRKEVLGI